MLGPEVNGASSSRPEIYCDSVPVFDTRPPVGRRGCTAIGGQPSGEDSSTPSPDSACSSGPIGRRWKYFWPTIVTGALASETRPVRKYRVVPELPTETSGRDGVQGPPRTMNVSPSM